METNKPEFKVWVITPCSRPQNLHSIAKSIIGPFHWVVAYDASVEYPLNKIIGFSGIAQEHHKTNITGTSGNGQRNHALDIVMEKAEDQDYLYFLDDDNIIHPNLMTVIEQSRRGYNADMIMFPQVQPSGAVRLMPPTEPKVGNIDTAMMIFRIGHVRRLRWHPYDYCADGLYAEEAVKGATKYINNTPACYYNYLQ